jgi:hypothetical protein
MEPVVLAADAVLGPNTLIPAGAVIVVIGAYAWLNRQFQDLKTALQAHNTRMEQLERAVAVAILRTEMELWIARVKLANAGKDVHVPDFPERTV